MRIRALEAARASNRTRAFKGKAIEIRNDEVLFYFILGGNRPRRRATSDEGTITKSANFTIEVNYLSLTYTIFHHAFATKIPPDSK